MGASDDERIIKMSCETPLIFIVGPTASGKSSFALEYAEKKGMHIVNADSVQVFKSLNIGTAKPTPSEMQRVAHHLFDFVDEGAEYTAADYRRDVLSLLDMKEKYFPKGVLVVGGSGFYIQALIKGMYSLPKVTEEVKEEVQKSALGNGWKEALQKVLRIDPFSKDLLHENDHYRIQRALEMIALTGKSPRQLQAEFEEKNCGIENPTLMLGFEIERDVLRLRVEERTKKMLTSGWIEEVKELRDRGLSDWAPMKSVGYLEVQSFLDAEMNKDEMEERINISTMQLAKKQMTWFRNRMQVQWCANKIQGEVLIREFLT